MADEQLTSLEERNKAYDTFLRFVASTVNAKEDDDGAMLNGIRTDDEKILLTFEEEDGNTSITIFIPSVLSASFRIRHLMRVLSEKGR